MVVHGHELQVAHSCLQCDGMPCSHRKPQQAPDVTESPSPLGPSVCKFTGVPALVGSVELRIFDYATLQNGSAEVSDLFCWFCFLLSPKVLSCVLHSQSPCLNSGRVVPL